MVEPDAATSGKNGIKTLAFRFQSGIHAQLSLIVQLRGTTFQDEVMAAVEAHIATAKADAALLSQVEAAQEAIEREAVSKRAAITSLFGDEPAVEGVAAPAEPKASATAAGRGQRRRAGSDGDTTDA